MSRAGATDGGPTPRPAALCSETSAREQAAAAPHSPCPTQTDAPPAWPVPRFRRWRRARECGRDAAVETRPGAAQSEFPRSSFASGRFSSGRICWSSRICQRSTPSTSAVARLRSAAESALTALPRSRSSECASPRSTASRISNAALRAGETRATASSQPHIAQPGAEPAPRRNSAAVIRFLPSSCTSSSSSHVSAGAGGKQPMVLDANLSRLQRRSMPRSRRLRRHAPCDARSAFCRRAR